MANNNENNVNVRTINILGETLEEQWRNAMRIHFMVAKTQIYDLRDEANDKNMDKLMKTINNISCETNKLLDMLFAEEQSK